VIKDDDDQVTQGYFHNQWDTQMGEETFGDASHMNDEQLGNKKLWWAKQIEEVEKEVQKRGLTIRQLRELEPETTGDQIDSDDDDETDEDDDAEADEDALLLLPGNYRQENYTREQQSEDTEEANTTEPGDYRRE